MGEYIFFYGTLRKSGTNYSTIESSTEIEYLGQYKTEHTYSFIGLTSGSFPYATEYTFPNSQKIQIVGDLYKIHENVDAFLTQIDKLEYNYTRQSTSILVDGKKIKAYIYVLTNLDFLHEIETHILSHERKRFVYIDSGDWIHWKGSSN